MEDIATRRVLCEVEGMDSVEVRRDLTFESASGNELRFDLYTPPAPGGVAPLPLVIIVAGYRDAGFQRIVGCRFKEMGTTMSWAQLIAASGLAAIVCTNEDPAADLMALLNHLRQNSSALALDDRKIGLWASSGNAAVALWILTQKMDIAAAALLYGFLLDLDGDTAVADAAKEFKFSNPAEGMSLDDLPSAVPLFLARAGRDESPRINESMDRFIARGLERNLPLEVVNHAGAPHAFDLYDDSAMTRYVVRRVLEFFRTHLLQA